MFPPNKERSHIMSKAECYDLLSIYSVQAIRYQKQVDKTLYLEQIKLLSKFCALLLWYHHEPVQAIIISIESAIECAFINSINKINYDLKYLVDRRKKIFAAEVFNQDEINKLTFKINALEQRKEMPSKEVIGTLVYDAIEIACKRNGTAMPDPSFLSQYRENVQTNSIQPGSQH